MDTLKQFLINEGEETYVAMAAYKAAELKVADEIEKLKLNLMKHHDAYMQTDRTSWGFAGDLNNVVSQLRDINDFIRTDK